MRLFSVICLFLLFPLLLLGNPISVHVKGLVCPSCAIGIKRHLMKTKKVDTIKFDTKKQYTYITVLKNKKLTDAEITTALENAGYELGKKGIQRD
jgi:copper chaperone CopZ